MSLPAPTPAPTPSPPLSPRLAATVIIPTSIDRGPVLRLAVESVLRQSVPDLEVFIIGDGVHDITRDTALALTREDSRVFFFDHPKHPRRGEPYRHEALQQARGRIVCYLCDRDLYLPGHVAEMQRLLARADMACSFPFRILEHGYCLEFAHDLSDPADRASLARCRLGVPLSWGAHTLDAYHRLDEGWTPTPPAQFTDVYFWSKFARHPHLRLATGDRPTVLNFPRGSHPGWRTARRLPEVADWARRIQNSDSLRAIESEVLRAALRDRTARARLLRRPLLITGLPPSWSLVSGLFARLQHAAKLYLLSRPDHPLAAAAQRWSRRRKNRPTD